MEPVLSPGVYVERGADLRPPLEGARAGECAFLGRTERGTTSAPMRVDSWAEYVQRFGGSGITGRAVQGFFRNGGERAWILSLGSTDHPLFPDDFLASRHNDGLFELERLEEPELVAAPELAALAAEGVDIDDVIATQLAIVAHCERMATRMALLDAPDPGDADRILAWRRHFDSSHAALLAPWILPRSSSTPLPPSGHIAGTWARCARDEGVHRAPANIALEEVVGTFPEFDRSIRTSLQLERICTLHSSAMRGVRAFGAWTPSTGATDQVNVRRLLIHIRRSVETWAGWVTFEPNHPALWKVLGRSVDAFLAELWRRGALAGDRPEDAWFVRCDDETNPPEARDAGRLCVDIGIAPVRPAEFLVVRIHQRTQEGRLHDSEETMSRSKHGSPE